MAQALEPEAVAYVPAVQLEQAVDAALRANVPGMHDVQLVLDAIPLPVWYFPAAHEEQSVFDDMPWNGWNFPGSHILQLVSEIIANPVRYFPEEQSVQLLFAVAPVLL